MFVLYSKNITGWNNIGSKLNKAFCQESISIRFFLNHAWHSQYMDLGPEVVYRKKCCNSEAVFVFL